MMMPPRAAGVGSRGSGGRPGLPHPQFAPNAGPMMGGNAAMHQMNIRGPGVRGGSGGYPDPSEIRRPVGTHLSVAPHPVEYAMAAFADSQLQHSSRREESRGHQGSTAMHQQQQQQQQQMQNQQLSLQQQQQNSQLLQLGRMSQSKHMYQSQGQGANGNPFGPGGPGPQGGGHSQKSLPMGSCGNPGGMATSPGFSNSARSMMMMQQPGSGSMVDQTHGGVFAQPPPPRRQQRSPATPNTMLSPSSYMNAFPFSYPMMDGPGAAAAGMMMMQGGGSHGAPGNPAASGMMMSPQQWRPPVPQGGPMMLMPGSSADPNQQRLADYHSQRMNFGGVRGEPFPSFSSSMALSHLGSFVSEGSVLRDGQRVESPQLKKSPRVRPVIYDERIDLCDDVDPDPSSLAGADVSRSNNSNIEDGADAPATRTNPINPPMSGVLNIQPDSPEDEAQEVEGARASAATDSAFALSGADMGQSHRFADDAQLQGYDDVDEQSHGYDTGGQSHSFDDSLMMANIQEILPISCDDEFLGVSSGQESFDLGSLLHEDAGGMTANARTGFMLSIN